MQLTNGEIYNTKEPMRKLMAAKLPVEISFELVRLSKLLKPHLDTIEEVRDKLIENYGEKHPTRPGGFQMNPEMEGFPKFAEELGILLAKTVELDFNIIKLPRTLQIEPYVIMALSTFVELEEAVTVETLPPKK